MYMVGIAWPAAGATIFSVRLLKKNIVTDEQRAGSCLDQAHEGGVYFAVGACFQYLELYPDDRSLVRETSLGSHGTQFAVTAR